MNPARSKILFCFWFLSLLTGFAPLAAQKTKEDSLLQTYRAAPLDPKAYTPLFAYWKKDKKDSALALANRLLKSGKTKKDSLLIADGYAYSGQVNYLNNAFDEALNLYKQADTFYGIANDTFRIRRIANNRFNTGKAYSSSGRSRIAVPEYEKAYKLYMSLYDTISAINQLVVMGDDIRLTGDMNGAMKVLVNAQSLAVRVHAQEQEARVYNNIANVYMGMEDTAQGLIYYRKSLAIKLKLGNKRDIANTYGNIGAAFMMGDYRLDSALYYFEKALPLRLEVKDFRGAASAYNNIGRVYLGQNRLPEAEQAIRQGLKIREEQNDIAGIASSYSALGLLYMKKKNYPESIRYYQQSQQIFDETGNRKRYCDLLQDLAQVHFAAGDYQVAYQYLDRFAILRDSLLNIDRAKEIAELQTVFEAGASEMKIKQLQQEKINSDLQHTADEEKQRNWLYIVIAGALLAVVVAGFFLFRHFENKKSSKRLQLAFNEIEEKNKNITDSIRYAQRIQESILPDPENFNRMFPQSFVLYKPKDIVSGDFWWAAAVTPEKNAFAVADCTGHGVPGAFMSVMGSALLTQTVKDKDVHDAAATLRFIDEGIRRQLKQSGNENETVIQQPGTSAQDGMDIAFLVFDMAKKQAEFAGAMRNLLHVRNGAATEIPAARFSIGGSYTTAKNFTNHPIDLQSGDMLYLSTDGFADQFGGPQGKKFKSARLKELLVSIAALPASKQQERLEKAFAEWKGSLDQVDDICVAGIRVL